MLHNALFLTIWIPYSKIDWSTLTFSLASRHCTASVTTDCFYYNKTGLCAKSAWITIHSVLTPAFGLLDFIGKPPHKSYLLDINWLVMTDKLGVKLNKFPLFQKLRKPFCLVWSFIRYSGCSVSTLTFYNLIAKPDFASKL